MPSRRRLASKATGAEALPLPLMVIGGVPEADMPISHVNKANERQRNKRKRKQSVFPTTLHDHHWLECTAPTTAWSMGMRAALCAVHTGSNRLRIDCRHLVMDTCTLPACLSPTWRIARWGCTQQRATLAVQSVIYRGNFKGGLLVTVAPGLEEETARSEAKTSFVFARGVTPTLQEAVISDCCGASVYARQKVELL
ncbi:hypothetical protein EAI_08842 [Harpegnathos saltator]|uniref:Uncharacterized protein n=1 Tax=Harpegnathos saltator TaxID=610380 RepID=E2CA26_HARSA|nr:hypothetical protein EAI_08842 [Harpegnathos saltator]